MDLLFAVYLSILASYMLENKIREFFFFYCIFYFQLKLNVSVVFQM